MEGKALSKPVNTILASLTKKEQQQLLSMCEPVTLNFGDVLYKEGSVFDVMYFPLTCILLPVKILEDKLTIETGMVGREGLVGFSALLSGDNIARNTVMVHTTGSALSIKADDFKQQCLSSITLRKEVLRYINTYITQMTQTAACNHFHALEARLARCLLMTRDRVRANQFSLTHKFLALLLGVRRERVSITAKNLQKRNIIHYSRGNITIIDSKLLEAKACRCYTALKLKPLLADKE